MSSLYSNCVRILESVVPLLIRAFEKHGDYSKNASSLGFWVRIAIQLPNIVFSSFNILAVLAVLVRSRRYTVTCRFRTKYNKSVDLTVNHDNRCWLASKKVQRDSIEERKTALTIIPEKRLCKRYYTVGPR